jgi:hypothetical protein
VQNLFVELEKGFQKTLRQVINRKILKTPPELKKILVPLPLPKQESLARLSMLRTRFFPKL